MPRLIRADATGATAAPFVGEVTLDGGLPRMAAVEEPRALALLAEGPGPVRVAWMLRGVAMEAAEAGGGPGWRLFPCHAGGADSVWIESAATPLRRARGTARPALRLWAGRGPWPDWTGTRVLGNGVLAGLPPRPLLVLEAGEAARLLLPPGFAPDQELLPETMRGTAPPRMERQGDLLLVEARAAWEGSVQLRPKSRANSA